VTLETTRDDLLLSVIRGNLAYLGDHLRDVGGLVRLGQKIGISGGGASIRGMLEARRRWTGDFDYVFQPQSSLRPLHEVSGRRYGHLSGQVDPRSAFDPDAMLRQALEIAAQGPNVMVKIPGTSEGLTVLRELSRRGIATNCTASYVVPQFVAVADNVQAGLFDARKAGVDLTGWKSVVTDMSARWENHPEFAASAASVGVELSPEDRRWAGIAVFKKAQWVFRERAYPSKMLICSVRVGPTVDGVQRCWHLEHTAGADAVFTLPPAFLTDFLNQCSDLTFSPTIWDDIPAEVMAKLRKVPYFNAGYEPDGIGVEDFDAIPALRTTYQEFAKATEGMVEFVAERMA
jgi:transaldolase